MFIEDVGVNAYRLHYYNRYFIDMWITHEIYGIWYDTYSGDKFISVNKMY